MGKVVRLATLAGGYRVGRLDGDIVLYDNIGLTYRNPLTQDKTFASVENARDYAITRFTLFKHKHRLPEKWDAGTESKPAVTNRGSHPQQNTSGGLGRRRNDNGRRPKQGGEMTAAEIYPYRATLYGSKDLSLDHCASRDLASLDRWIVNAQHWMAKPKNRNYTYVVADTPEGQKRYNFQGEMNAKPCPVCGQPYGHEWNCSLNQEVSL